MVVKIDVPLREIQNAVDDVQREIHASQPGLMELLGVELLMLAQLAYRDKSRGGTGSDNIKWKPLKPATIERKNRKGRRKTKRGRRGGSNKSPSGNTKTEIGVDTGVLQFSASPGYRAKGGGGNIHRFSAYETTVGFGISYAEYFDEVRKLLPDPLPDAWEEEINELVNDHYSEILGEQL